ncbi:hypothetical protein BS47DRAFT_1347405, partial [Hydnum rufescens UP504]
MGHNTCWHHRDISGSDHGQENCSCIANRGNRALHCIPDGIDSKLTKRPVLTIWLTKMESEGHGRVQYSML